MKKNYQGRKQKIRLNILVAVVVVTIGISTVSACSSSEKSVFTEELTTDSVAPVETEIILETTPADTLIMTEEIEPTILETTEPETEQMLSEDAQQIQKAAYSFIRAYFEGDKDAIKEHLVSPYDWDIEIYFDPQKVPDVSLMSLNGLDGIQDKNAGDICVLSFQYKNTEADDTFQHLTMEFIKDTNGWKIQFYGLE